MESVKVKVYQVLENTHDKAFMGWDFIKEHGFSFSDYTLVGEFETTNTHEYNDILENVFTFGNSAAWSKKTGARSISVSDIVELNGKYFYVDMVGFKDITSFITDKITESKKLEEARDVDEYINQLSQDLESYSTLLFDSIEDCLLANEKQRKRALKKALKTGNTNYSDSFLNTELEFTEQVIKELQKRIKEGNINKLEEDNFEDIDDKEVFDDLKNQEEPTTILDLLQDRIGQDMTIGELNTVLQSIFGKYDDIFLLHNDLYNADIDEPQDLVIWDDEDMYTITFNIKDIEEAIIEITDVNVE